MSDLDCQKMDQIDFGWFEAYYRVLPFGCGKMTTAHFETESTRALEMCRDVIVRENIKGDRKKNPTLNKDRSIVLGQVSTDLLMSMDLELKQFLLNQNYKNLFQS